MEQKSSPLMKSSLTAGLYIGLISILISVIIWAGGLIESMGLFGSSIIGIVSLVITFVLLLLFAKSYRNKELGGYISFADAFKYTILVIVVSTVISVIYNYVFHSFIAPDYMENLYAILEQKMVEYMDRVGAPEAQVEKALERFEEVPNVWKTLQQTALNGIIAGGIIALIVSAIVRKKVESDL